ncbi:unnamed protein product (macronuclear) [Paramecium tetraurelia]|uniref:SPRY domain-containing protein n=1 Tax=Paramecium tetraurelia TaxID=5888 RepID=A0C803_PARTE|nr:uncharacterized protein GSPATT00036051001 [Paramecium tetraurelia]CAK66920.1 unnamed protein product [Paramecium tetraurelia]|eukprot:XP_001434317.1 hypothetical protein (macronuclear) [Paramecium tetraurelia strain d4-2]
MELDKLEADNQFYDSIEQMFQSFTSNPSYNQVIDHLQQNRNTDKQQEVKAFGIQNQKELDKSKTPCLNIKCNKHGKEIIMLNLEQNQVESSRLICVDCIHNNDPIKYTSLQNANLRWKYKNQDKIRADQNSRLLQQESIISNLKEIREQHNKILCELIEKLNNEQQSIQEVLQNQLDQTDIYEFNQEQIEEITLILCKKDKLTVSSDLQANIDQEDQIRYNLITNNLTNLFEYGLLKREEILKILGQDNSFAETLNDSIKSNEILRNGKVFIKEKYQVFKEDCQNLTLQINNLDQQLKEKNINITKVNELLQQKEQQLTQLQRDCKDVQYLQLQIQIQQLLQQQEQNQILNQYPFKLTFSQQFKHDACQISQDGKMVILHGMCGMYCCICDQIIPKHGLVKFAFRILNNSYLMIGICFRDMIQKNGYYDNYGKGAYFIDKDGKCFNHDQYDKNDKCISFKFTFNDIVIVEVDIQNKYIKWIKQSTNESYVNIKLYVKKLNIDTTQDLYPCVNLHYYSKAEIFSQFNE